MEEIKTYFSNELKAVVMEINGFVTTEKFKEVALETHNLRKKHFVKKQLNNIRNMKILTKEIQLWLNDVWFPAAKSNGLEHFAFVVPNSPFGELSMKEANKEAKKKYGINIEYFTNEESAKQWLISK